LITVIVFATVGMARSTRGTTEQNPSRIRWSSGTENIAPGHSDESYCGELRIVSEDGQIYYINGRTTRTPTTDV